MKQVASRAIKAKKILLDILHAAFLLGLFLDAEMEATCSPETLDDFQRTAPRYISEDRTTALRTSNLTNASIIYELKGILMEVIVANFSPNIPHSILSLSLF
jgi:hypothetical protein